MPTRTQTYPLRTLFRFLLLIMVGAYLGLLGFLWHGTIAKIQSELRYTNSFMAQAVRTTLKEHELILRGMGSELVSLGALDDPEKGRQLIERMNKIDPGMVGFGLARPDGQLVLVSGIAKGKPLPNLATMSQAATGFHEILSSEHLRTGRPYYFNLLSDWVVPIRVAIRDNGGKVQAMMAAGYSIENATTAWSNVTLLPDVKVALLGADGYIRYAQPLPAGPKQEILKKFFGTPIDKHVQQLLSEIKTDSAFLEAPLPNAGDANYIAYTHIAQYGLRSAAFIERSIVIKRWLDSAMVPTSLMLLIVAGGILVYRRALQQQLRANSKINTLSAWQQAVLDSADYSIISTDTDGMIVSYNKTAQRMLGYTADEMIGKATPTLIHASEEIEQRAAELSKEMQTNIKPGFEVFTAKASEGKVDEHEWTYIRKDGSRFPVHLSVSALKTNGGNIIGFLGIAYDLTEQKVFQAVLRDSEARYRILFEHAGDAIFLMKDELFVDCNPATLKMFGCTREQIVGQTPMRFSPEFQPDGRPSLEKALEKIQAAYSGTTQFFEWRHARYDGTTFDAEVTLNIIEIGNEPHLLANVRDVSARKRNEYELEQSRQSLLRNNESLRLLNQLSQRLHVSLDLDDILHETTQALLGLSHTPNIAVYLVDPDDESQLQLVASHGFSDDLRRIGKTLPITGSLSGMAIVEGKVVETNNINADDRVYTKIRQALAAIGAISAIAIPMFYQNRPLGSITLVYNSENSFDQTIKETLMSLGNTVALAITNARHVDHLEFQAKHDSLTHLPNRILLHETVYNNIRKMNRAVSPKQVVLMLLDLDRFKEINDTLGHQIGDRVLTKVGARLKQHAERYDMMTARLGGDEFAISLYKENAIENSFQLAKDIVDALHQPFEIEGIKLTVRASMGIAYYPQHGNNSHALLRAADVAMYHAKKHAPGIMIYNTDFDGYTTERLTLANELVQATEQNQLRLHYQPKIDLSCGKVTGFEALVRWQHPRLGLIFPDMFVHLAEMSDIIHPFTRHIIEYAARDKQHLRELGYQQPIAINLSAINLSDIRCLGCLKQALESHELDSGELELELTETALMHEGEHALNLLQQFNEMGINIAIDDFGIGYSSLSYLRRLPIKALKIDKSFVMDMLDNHQDSTIVRSTIDLAHNLELLVIAEGVENEETQNLLRSMGCDQAQGFGICRPQDMDKLIDWLSQYKPAKQTHA